MSRTIKAIERQLHRQPKRQRLSVEAGTCWPNGSNADRETLSGHAVRKLRPLRCRTRWSPRVRAFEAAMIISIFWMLVLALFATSGDQLTKIIECIPKILAKWFRV